MRERRGGVSLYWADQQRGPRNICHRTVSLAPPRHKPRQKSRRRFHRLSNGTVRATPVLQSPVRPPPERMAARFSSAPMPPPPSTGYILHTFEARVPTAAAPLPTPRGSTWAAGLQSHRREPFVGAKARPRWQHKPQKIQRVFFFPAAEQTIKRADGVFFLSLPHVAGAVLGLKARGGGCCRRHLRCRTSGMVAVGTPGQSFLAASSRTARHNRDLFVVR